MSVIEPQSIRLSDEFLSQYRGRQPKWGFGGLGWVIYLRTYARKTADGTLESWDETVRRFTEGNFQIEADRLNRLGKLTPERLSRLVTEMERFYHLAFNLVILPPGRGIWMSGTDYEKRSGDALNNCWFVSMRPQPYFANSGNQVSFAPVFTFDQAMKGGGVGVSVQRKNVEQIPKVQTAVKLRFVCDPEHPDFAELQQLGVEPRTVWDYGAYSVLDAREGWADSLGLVIDSHYEMVGINPSDAVFDISLIRPRGSEIKGFGGVASGPAPLVDMLQKVNDILNGRVNDYVTPTEWGDVIQLIGTCVVSGNVRRTALILIGDQDDADFVQSKNYSLPQNAKASQWRWASNNSVDIDQFTDRLTLVKVAENIYYNGEPGVVLVDLARNYGRIIDGYQPGIDDEVEGFNPCGEITLPNASPCNLFEISLPRVHELVETGIEDEGLYREVMMLGVRYAYRVTFRNYEWEATRDVVERHRRLGVGLTGITDWVLLKFGAKAILGFDADGNPQFNPDVTAYLDQMYKFGRSVNASQASELEANCSIKITTVKPSGSCSLLMGVSPGMHWHWAPYMIRRVRMSASAPLVPILQDCGYDVEFAIAGWDESGSYKYDFNTVVVSFPVKAPTAEHPEFQSAGDVPLREQAALQALLATYWADNAVSATLSFHKPKPKPVFDASGNQLLDKFGNPVLQVYPSDEQRVIDEIADILDRYKGTIKSTSLLPYATDTYPQMPYEAISKDTYDTMVGRLKNKPWELVDGGIIAEADSLDSSIECVGASCPVR